MTKQKIIIAGLIVTAVFVGLFYISLQRGGKNVPNTAIKVDQTTASWQKITIEEARNNTIITINSPKIIIYGNYDLASKANAAIAERIEYAKDWFTASVSTAAEDNGETNTLSIDTEVLLLTPRLISLAFTTTEHLAGIKNNDPERTFVVFDFIKGKSVFGKDFFHDTRARLNVEKTMKDSLRVNYPGQANCDLLYAPKKSGFATSCIGVDESRGRAHLSLIGETPLSSIQEFLAPSVLSNITKP